MNNNVVSLELKVIGKLSSSQARKSTPEHNIIQYNNVW